MITLYWTCMALIGLLIGVGLYLELLDTRWTL